MFVSDRFIKENFKGVWRINPIGDKRDVLRGFRISDEKTLSLAERERAAL